MVTFLENIFRAAVVVVSAAFGALAEIVMAILVSIGPVAAPLVPAIIFGWNVYDLILTLSGFDNLALAVAVAGAIGLESAGFVAAKNAIEFWNGGGMRRHLSVAVVVAYNAVGIAAGGVEALINSQPMAFWISIFAFSITDIVYLSVALREGSKAERQAGMEKERFEREQKRQDILVRAQARAISTAAPQAQFAAPRRAPASPQPAQKASDLMDQVWQAGMTGADLRSAVEAKFGVTLHRSTASRYVSRKELS